MGFFDRVAASHFSSTDEGTPVYHPFGAFGRGRIVNDPDRLARIQRFHKRQLQLGVPLSVLLGMLLGSAGPSYGLVAMIAVAVLLPIWRGHTLVRGLPLTQRSLGVRAVVQRNAGIFRWIARSQAVCGVILLAIALALPFAAPDRIAEAIPLIAISLGVGLSALLFGLWLLRVLRTTKRQES